MRTPSQRTRVRLPRTLFEKLSAVAAAERRQVDAVVVDAVRSDLARNAAILGIAEKRGGRRRLTA